MLTSLRAQLGGGGSSPRNSPMQVFNADGCVDSSRCVAVAWLERSGAVAFVSAYSSGFLYLYHKACSTPVNAIALR